MSADGALEMLEAYAALPSDAVRRVVLQHARALLAALKTDALQDA